MNVCLEFELDDPTYTDLYEIALERNLNLSKCVESILKTYLQIFRGEKSLEIALRKASCQRTRLVYQLQCLHDFINSIEYSLSAFRKPDYSVL